MKPIKNIIEENTDNYLIVDGVYPIITSSTVYDEALIYRLSEEDINACITDFNRLTNKFIDSQTKTTQLSFGQKILLSILLSLHSVAENIFLHKVKSSLDLNLFESLENLIQMNFSGKNIKFSNE